MTNPVDVLKLRLALGEINLEEYLKLHEVLSTTQPLPASSAAKEIVKEEKLLAQIDNVWAAAGSVDTDLSF